MENGTVTFKEDKIEKLRIGGYEEVEVGYGDKWNKIRCEGKEYSSFYVQHPFDKDAIIENDELVFHRVIRYDEIKFAHEDELRNLLQSWRDRGFNNQADAVEFAPEDGDIWPYLSKFEPAIEEVRLPIKDCKFILGRGGGLYIGTECPKVNLEVKEEEKW